MNRRSFFKRAAGAAAIPVAAAVAAALPEPSDLIATAKATQRQAFDAAVAEHVERKMPLDVWNEDVGEHLRRMNARADKFLNEASAAIDRLGAIDFGVSS